MTVYAISEKAFAKDFTKFFPDEGAPSFVADENAYMIFSAPREEASWKKAAANTEKKYKLEWHDRGNGDAVFRFELNTASLPGKAAAFALPDGLGNLLFVHARRGITKEYLGKADKVQYVKDINELANTMRLEEVAAEKNWAAKNITVDRSAKIPTR